MKSSALVRPGRITAFAAVMLALAASMVAARVPQASLQPPPGPCAPGDPLSPPLTYISGVHVSRGDLDTCPPPPPCAGRPVVVTVYGAFPNMCGAFLGLHEALDSTPELPVLVAELREQTTGGCPDVVTAFYGSISLPAQTAGPHAFVLRLDLRSFSDTTVVRDSSEARVGYDVGPECPTPIPVDSLVRTFVSLRIVPEHPCAGDTVTLQLVTNGCPPCVHLVSFGNVAPGNVTFEGVIDWTPNCFDFACIPETLSTSMGQLAQGSYGVSAPMTVRVLGTGNPDSTIQFRLPFAFQVGPPCTNPPGPCVAREMFSIYPPGQCALTLAPGDSGVVPLLYSSELPMAGVEGTIQVPRPFRLTDLRLASHLTGVHLFLARHELGPGLRWLVITDPGVTLEPGARQHLLNATITADPMIPVQLSELMTATITLASDADGNALPLCNRNTLDIVAIRLCVTAQNSLCDVNHDGRLDVRDLVRMVSCLPVPLSERGVDARPASADSAGTSPCVDCDSSGAFDLNDIFCCAMDILRGPLVPRDSVRTDAAVSVGFDPIEALGSGDLLVRVRVRGARALGAAMLRFDYPGTGWRAHIPTGDAPGPQQDWYPIVDVSQPGRIDVGGLRLGDSGSDEFTFELAMTPLITTLRGPTSTGQLETVAADLAARDGSVITPMGALPSVVLEPGATTDGDALALSPARPNPFNGSTTFVVRLPASAPVDLAIHDIAGRRITTLAHAVYGPGEHSFSWDGAGAHDGLYFVRLTVNGQVLSTRVAMLRGTR